MIALNKGLQRKTLATFRHYRVPLVVELLPGDVIRLREHKRRYAVSISIHDLYAELVRRDAARKRMQKFNARRARAKQRKS